MTDEQRVLAEAISPEQIKQVIRMVEAWREETCVI